MKVSVRHKEAGRQKDNFYQRHCYGCCANASICHCLVLTVVPTTGFTAAASQICWEGDKKKKEVVDLCEILLSQSSHCGEKAGSEL